MDHVVDYVVKGSRPKKPIVMLWGTSPDMARLFRSSSDLYSAELHAGTIKAHAATQPLFSEVSTLWSVGVPDMPLLKALCQGEVHQPIVFECVTKNDLPEFDSSLKAKIKVLSISEIKAGSKPHKHIILWGLKNEFPEIDSKILEALADLSSPHFSSNILYGIDRLAQKAYLLPQGSLASVADLKKMSMSISAEQWEALLHPKDTAIIYGLMGKLFEKSRSAYHYLNAYYAAYDSPLPLLKALADVVEQYIECGWALRENLGHEQGDPSTFVQGRRIPRHVLITYQEKVIKFFGEKLLWDFAKDISLTQAKYRTGVTSKLPMYLLLGRYIGAGI